MKAALLETEGRIAIVEAERPSIGPDDVLIRVAYAGVCGSDLHSFEGSHPFRKPPVILGHELSGTVVERGERVESLAIGDPVTVMPYIHCGRCAMCRRGRTNICLNKIVPGIKGWAGTFAEYFRAPAAVTYKLGERTSLREGALAEPLAVAVHSVAQGRVGQGDRVLILGAGTIGLLTGIAARQAGASAVAITDLYEYNLSVGCTLGFDAAYRADQQDLVQRIRADYAEGFDVLFLTSGAAVTVTQSLELAQRTARIVATAIFPRPVTLDIGPITQGELELIGTSIYTDLDFRRALLWLDEHVHPFERLIDHELPLDAAQGALEMLAGRTEDAIKVLLRP
ncbi:MAG: alcohol dehydrogenase catalytic domain-containing protein [Chloroflexi bacterium]|nr:alcohol dehydrogenase catalytic domain-containing protein [Chloroflexota bacterium]